MAFTPDRRLLAAAILALAVVGPALAANGAPGSPAAPWVARARAEYRAGDHFAALATARGTVARFPTDPAALYLEAQLLRDAKGVVPSLPLFRRAALRASADTDLLADYAATLGEAGENRAMLKLVRKIAEIEPTNARAVFLQAVLAARAGQDDLAQRLLWRIRPAEDVPPAILLLTGILELRSGRPAEAVEQLQKLVDRQPDNAMATMLLGRALLANDEPSEVVERLAPLAGRGDASPYVLTLVGRAYEQLGERAMAARYLDRATQPLAEYVSALPVSVAGPENGGPATPGSQVDRMRALLAQGQREQALVQARQMSAKYPGSADVLRILGDAQMLAGDGRAASTSYRQASTVRSDSELVRRLALLDPAQARGSFLARLAANPRERATVLALAHNYARTGEGTQAAAWRVYAATLGR